MMPLAGQLREENVPARPAGRPDPPPDVVEPERMADQGPRPMQIGNLAFNVLHDAVVGRGGGAETGTLAGNRRKMRTMRR